MPQVTQEDEMHMLYQAFKLTGAKPSMNDLAIVMGLKTATAHWRWAKMMKRLAEQYDGQAPTAAQPASTKSPMGKVNGTKRKRAEKEEDEEKPSAKKVATETDSCVKQETHDESHGADKEAGESSED